MDSRVRDVSVKFDAIVVFLFIVQVAMYGNKDIHLGLYVNSPNLLWV